MFNKERVEIIDFQKEAKRRQKKEEFQRKKKEMLTWIDNNKELIILVAPALIGLVTTGVKSVNKQVKLEKEKKIKELYCYDPSLGHYWKLRRELTNSEWIEIDRRKQNGERLANILDEFKVLK